MSEPTFNPAIVNANIGIANCIEENDINTVIINTFKEIADILSDHCGPYGKYAMIPNVTSALIAEPTFTKDGINIVRALEYASPMQTYVKQFLAYMGSRIERAAGDGTTSAMIICATALRLMIERVNALYEEDNICYTFDELETEYQRFVQDIEKQYAKIIDSDYVFTVETLAKNAPNLTTEEIIYRVAYGQAYTSSHGNRTLSEAIASLFAFTPKIAWDYMSISKSSYESDKPFYIEVDHNQYTINNARIFPTAAMTEKLGTECYRENIPTIMTVETPNMGNTETEALLNVISSAIIEGKPLAVICPDDMDRATHNWLSDMFDKNPEHQTIFFFVPIKNIQLNDIINLKLFSNNFHPLAMPELKLKFNGKDLMVNNIYDNPTDSIIHPYYRNKDYPDYNMLLDHIDKLIDQINSEVANRNNNYQLVELQKLRLKLTVTKRHQFMISGVAYDAAALIDIVIDCMLAVKNTLTKGFVYGGNISLYNTISNLNLIPATDKYKKLYDIYCYSFLEAIKTVHEANYKYTNIVSIDMPTHAHDITKDIDDPVQTPTVRALLERPIETCKEYPVIIQPKLVDLELIKRFGEIALKFIKMHRIIVPGGLYTNPEKE